MNRKHSPFFPHPQNHSASGRPDEPERRNSNGQGEAYSLRDEVTPFFEEGDTFSNLLSDDLNADIEFGPDPQSPASSTVQDEPIPEWLSVPGGAGRSAKAASRQAYEAEARAASQADFAGVHDRAHVEAPQAGQAPFDFALLDDAALTALCKERVCPACSVKQAADDVLLRAAAELDNSRKRLAREREEQVRFAAEAVLSDILPSLDNLDLALQHVGANEACKDFAAGVRMTRQLLLDSLKKHGLHVVGTVGEAFDPALHEAVGMDPAAEVPKDHISRLLTSGYTLNGRLLRPARVMVSG